MKRAILILALVFAAATAFGYGREGHEAIAELARQMLTPNARAAVVRMLGNDGLAAISTWADELKLAEHGQGPLANNSEAVAVNAKFPMNHLWHFADLPLGTTIYRDNDKYASNDDIVHAINRCIGTLEAPPGQRTDLTKSEALKFLVHLVGDIHGGDEGQIDPTGCFGWQRLPGHPEPCFPHKRIVTTRRHIVRRGPTID